MKLAIKYSRPRRVAAKSARPSHVLLVGSPPRRLEHDLSSAGHDVEVEPSAGNARRAKYDIVVVASNDQADDARSKFPDAAVVVRSGDITADVRSVESQADRRPVAVAAGREVIAAGPVRTAPIAARPNEAEHPVAVKEAANTVVAAKQPEQQIAAKPAEPPPAPTPTPAPAPPPPPAPAITTTTSSPPETKAAPATSARLHTELYFSINSSRIADTRRLDQAVHWLSANPDVHAAVEGYADPTGTPEGNMALSQQRAEAVRDYLVAHGIDTARLDVTPYGDTKLLYGRNDGRNRRVAIEATR